MPSFESSGLGRAEYEECIFQVAELADPNPSKKEDKGAHILHTRHQTELGLACML